MDVASKFDDPDDDQLDYTATSSQESVVRVSVTGSTVTYEGLAEGRATVTVTATDPGKLTATQSFRVMVEQPNRAPTPVGTITNRTVNVGESGSVDVASKFSDPDDDKLKYTVTSSDPDEVGVDVSGSTVTYSGEAEGSATVTVKATDPGLLLATQSFVVTVVPCTDAGANAGRDDEVLEGTGVTLDGRGSSGVHYRWSQTAGPRVTLSGANGRRPRFNAPQVNGKTALTFRLTVTGECGDTDTDEVTITVTDTPKPNRSPTRVGTIANQTVVAGASEAVVVSPHFSDPDGDKLTYLASSSDRTVATVSARKDTVLVRGVSKGSADITVTARDPHSAEVSQRFQVTVEAQPPTNRPPKVASAIPAQSVVAGGSLSVKVSPHFSDPDGDKLTYLASSSDLNAATVSVSANTVFVRGVSKGTADVTVTARDPSGAEVKQKFKVTVTAPPSTNLPPKVASAIPAQSVVAGGSLSVKVSPHFSDPDGDDLTYSASSSDRTVAMVSARKDTVLVRGVSKGSADITVTARDPRGASVSQSFRVRVAAGNAAPEVVSAIPALTVGAGESRVVDVSGHFRDPDGDGLTYEAGSSNEAAATVVASGSEVTVTGVFRGASRVTVTARDGRGGSVSQDFAVTVPNRSPEAVGALAALTVSKGDTGSVSVSGGFRDPDGDELKYTATSSAAGVLAVEVDGDRVKYEALKLGTSRVTVTADDGLGGTADQEFGVTVGEANAAPEVVGAIGALTVAADSSASVDVSGRFRDPDGDELAFGAVSSDEGVAAVSSRGSLVTVTGVSRGASVVTFTAARDPETSQDVHEGSY